MAWEGRRGRVNSSARAQAEGAAADRLAEGWEAVKRGTPPGLRASSASNMRRPMSAHRTGQQRRPQSGGAGARRPVCAQLATSLHSVAPHTHGIGFDSCIRVSRTMLQASAGPRPPVGWRAQELKAAGQLRPSTTMTSADEPVGSNGPGRKGMAAVAVEAALAAVASAERARAAPATPQSLERAAEERVAVEAARMEVEQQHRAARRAEVAAGGRRSQSQLCSPAALPTCPSDLPFDRMAMRPCSYSCFDGGGGGGGRGRDASGKLGAAAGYRSAEAVSGAAGSGA